MKFDEVKTALTELFKDKDKGLADLPDFLDKLKGDYDAMAGMVDKLAEADTKIRTLQDTNMRLLLAQISPAGEEHDDSGDDLTGVDAIEHFWGELEKEE